MSYFSALVVFVLTFNLLSFSVNYGAEKSTPLADRVKSAILNYYLEDFAITDMGNGKIKIEGRVHTLYDKLRIFSIAARVPGVKAIQNNVVVDTPTLPDDMIAVNIRKELNVNESILEPDRIKIKVNNGIVFLSGEVSFLREKEIAATIASWQKGVRGVVNQIRVLPPKEAISDQNLTTIVRELLKHQFPLEKSIHFTIKNGVVTLEGNCSTLWAKEEITKQLLRIRGIRQVINHLQVVPLEE